MRDVPSGYRIGRMDQPPRRRFQFHLSTLFVAMTAAAVAFAVIGRVGVEGFFERLGVALSIAGIFVPLVEFYYWWKDYAGDGF